MYLYFATLIYQTRNKIDSNYVSFYGIILSVKKSPSFENLRIVTFTDNSRSNLICNIFIEEELLWAISLRAINKSIYINILN